MKPRTLFYAALGLLVMANFFVLIHAARNRGGEPDAGMELTERELRYYPHGNDDSSLTLMLQWQNPAMEFRYPPAAENPVGFFDRAKLEELGFDVRVAPDAKEAERFYRAQRSREVFVALEYDGAAWQQWLKAREEVIATETRYAPQIGPEDRMRIERETGSRLVAVDVGLNPARLREKFPDRKKVLILPGRARAVLDGGPSRVTHDAVLRGAITAISIDNINVPNFYRSQLAQHTSYNGWSMTGGGTVTIDPPAFAVALRVGSLYETWVTAVRTLR